MEGEAYNTFFEQAVRLEVGQQTALQHNAPIEFMLRPINDWIDLPSTTVEFAVKITTADGTTDIAATTDVGPINNLLHSMFTNVDIELNGKPVSDPTGLYPYVAQVATLLETSEDAQKNRGQLALYYHDPSPALAGFSSLIPTSGIAPNPGLNSRRVAMGQARRMILRGKLFADIFQMNRPLMPGVSLKIRLIPSSDQFLLVTPTSQTQVAYQLRIEVATLKLKILKATSTYALEFENSLMHKTAQYPLTVKRSKIFTIPNGQTSFTEHHLITGERPEHVTVLMVTDASRSGGYQQNPFNFVHSNINYINLNFNGQPIMESPYTPNFTNSNFESCYFGLLESLGLANSNKGIAVTRDNYANGYTIFGFDLTVDRNPLVRDPVRVGTVGLEIKFSTATTAVHNLIVIAEYKSVIEIDSHRNVITAFPG